MPLFVTLRRASARPALVLVWVWTVAMAYTVNDWFPRAVSGFFQQPLALGIALFLGVSTFTAALQYMAFAACYRRITTLSPSVIPCLTAAAWVAADLGRVRLFGGDPWALLGYSQAGGGPLAQVADLAGVHGITFLLVAVNAGIAEVWCTATARRAWTPALVGLAAATLGVVAALLYGTARISQLTDSGTPPVPAAVIQAHLSVGSQWHSEYYGRNLDAYLRLSLESLRGTERPRLLVWPENAMTFFLADEPSFRHAIGNLLSPFGAQLIAGGPVAGSGSRDYLNAAFLIGPDGEIHGRYDKRILLPFAEYFPFGRIDLLQRRFGRVREFIPGGERPLLDTTLGPVGVIICNEGFFPESAADRVRAGATVLVNLSNDSWLGDPKFSEPSFDMVTLRAVEQRRWIIRASTSGPSALIDPVGRVAQRTGFMTTGTLVGLVQPREGRTLYCQIGDAFAWLCVAVTGIACIWRPGAHSGGGAAQGGK